MKRVLLCMFFLTISIKACHAQVPVSLAPVPVQQFFDGNGHPLANGKLFSYQAGTNTLQATYMDSTGNGQNLNPTILDSNGRAQIWLARLSYKLVLQNAAGQQIWNVDNVKDGALSLLTGNNVWLGTNIFNLPTTFMDSANINVGGFFGGTITGSPSWANLQLFPAGFQVGGAGLQATQPTAGSFGVPSIDFRATTSGPTELRVIPNGYSATVSSSLTLMRTDTAISAGNDEWLNFAAINVPASCGLVATPCYRMQSVTSGTGTRRPMVFDIAGGAPSVLFDIDGTAKFTQPMTLSAVSSGNQLRLDPGVASAPGIRFIGTEASGHTFVEQENAGHFTIQDQTGPATLLDLSASAGAQVPSLTVSAFTFVNIGSCTGPLTGKISAVVDSTTNTWGATITGGGADIVLAFCNGTNWTVFGK